MWSSGKTINSTWKIIDNMNSMSQSPIPIAPRHLHKNGYSLPLELRNRTDRRLFNEDINFIFGHS